MAAYNEQIKYKGEKLYNYTLFQAKDCHDTNVGKCCDHTSAFSQTVFLWLKQQ